MRIPSKRVEEIWIKGWLKNKQYCYNFNHVHYNPLIDHLVRDLNRGQNRIIIIVGTPRSGKSWFSIWLMSYLNYCYYGKKTTIKDMYWKIDDFLEATKDPVNWNKFITLEEQGVEQYAKDFWREEVKDFDKITQIFGVDETNLIINLPYIFDLTKGTRLKGHYLLRALRKKKDVVNIVMCKRRMNLTTEKAYYSPLITWEKIPNAEKFVPNIIKEYEKLKREYNAKKKDELLKKRTGKIVKTDFPKPMIDLNKF
jgi:hypothetical protein